MRYLKEMKKGRNARSVNGKILEELDEVVYLGSYFVKMNFDKMKDTKWMRKDVPIVPGDRINGALPVFS